MTTGVFGGGVIFVVAALLWAAVLVPSWVRRREYRAAEQNAARLQRTLRVLAETAEVPTEVRVEATAREALAHEKILRTARKQQEAERQAKLAQARAAQVRAEMQAQKMKRTQATLTRAARLRRPAVRRARACTALVLVCAFAGVLVGTGLAIAGQGALVVTIAGLSFVAALGGLVLMAPGRAVMVEIPAEQEVAQSRVLRPAAVAETDAALAADDASAAHAAAQEAAAARIARARALARARAESPTPVLQNQPDSILLERVAEPVSRGAGTPDAAPLAAGAATSGSATPTSGSATATSAASARASRDRAAERLRQMGVVGDTSDGALDIDSVLRDRRRAS